MKTFIGIELEDNRRWKLALLIIVLFFGLTNAYAEQRCRLDHEEVAPERVEEGNSQETLLPSVARFLVAW